MAKHIFRFIGTSIDDNKWQISGDDCQHMRKVLRLSVGDSLEVTDGNGLCAAGRISSFDGGQVQVSIETLTRHAPEPRKLMVGMGATKIKTMDETIPALVELGASVIIVFYQEGSEHFRINEKVIDRWHRLIREALKQCKRTWLPKLLVYDKIEKLAQDATLKNMANRFVCHPESDNRLLTVGLADEDALILIGNEHGFSDEEFNFLVSSGFRGVNLGSGVLRAEIAALAATSVLAQRNDAWIKESREQ